MNGSSLGSSLKQRHKAEEVLSVTEFAVFISVGFSMFLAPFLVSVFIYLYLSRVVMLLLIYGF